MANYKYVALPDENIIAELEGEFYASSSNPLARLFGNIKKFLDNLVGNKVRGGLVVTNKRLIFHKEQYVCWCLARGNQNYSINPSSINQVGYNREGTAFKRFDLIISTNSSETVIIQLKGASEQDALNYVNAIYSLIK